MTWMGRIDLIKATCPTCKGDKRDPRKKKRKCPMCSGSGIAYLCPKCEKEQGECTCTIRGIRV